jgi:penicillin-binding protein 1A
MPRWLRRLLLAFGVVMMLSTGAGIAGALWILSILPRPLPSLDILESFAPREGSQLYDAGDEFLTELHAERQIFVPLARVSHWIPDALIATEDRRFYAHWGLDPLGIARAMARNVRSGRIREGGSTLTQQLAKMLFLTPDRSLARKVTEAVLALQIERRYPKRRIVELYLNQAYFGAGAYGIEAAARTYFGKSASDVTVREAALLAGLPRAPASYAPFEHPEAARQRRDLVLRRMVAAGVLSETDGHRWRAADLGLVAPERRPNSSRYFLAYVQGLLEARYGADRVFKGGSASIPRWIRGCRSPRSRPSGTGFAASTGSPRRRPSTAPKAPS